MSEASASASRMIVLVGPSGSGKTTLAHALLQRHNGRCVFSVSHSTRPQRSGEVDGVDYHFITRSRFQQMVHQGAFVESAEVHGNLYGTAHSEIDAHLQAGRDVVFDVDIVGAHNLYASYPGRTLLIFVVPPSWQGLVERLLARGSETEETLRRRLSTARRELQAVADSDAPWQMLVNDELSVATDALLALIGSTEGSFDAARTDSRLETMVADARTDPRAVDDPVHGEPDRHA